MNLGPNMTSLAAKACQSLLRQGNNNSKIKGIDLCFEKYFDKPLNVVANRMFYRIFQD